MNGGAIHHKGRIYVLRLSFCDHRLQYLRCVSLLAPETTLGLEDRLSGKSVGRPTGVTILALFEFFIASLLLLFALAAALGVGALGAILARTREIGAPGFALFAGAGMMVAVILLVPAVLFSVLGFGLWNLRNWARITTIVLAVFGVAGASIGLLWGLCISGFLV
jgi:hypothetical protein